ncbi:hypothetical protein P3T23_008739 [Paraburkholderia sp. GAS448]
MINFLFIAAIGLAMIYGAHWLRAGGAGHTEKPHGNKPEA